MTVISLPAPWTPLERCDEAVAAARPGIWATFVPPGFDVGRHRLRPPRKLCEINGDVFLRCMYDSDAAYRGTMDLTVSLFASAPITSGFTEGSTRTVVLCEEIRRASCRERV